MQTLVLDAGYQPVERVGWQKAIVWVLDRLVEVVDEYPDKYINTVTWSVKMPSVVRFVKPISRKRAVKFSRHNVYARDRERCQYCREKLSRAQFTYDHVIPRAQGGRTCWENVVVSCSSCNLRKANRTPEQAGMRLLSTPVRPKRLFEAPRQIAFSRDMPSSWREWLRDAVYWDGELESDGG